MTSYDAQLLDWPLALGFENRELTASDGARLRVIVGGDPAAPPVVLVHGAPQHAYEWRLVMPMLTKRFRVIAPDLRGYGASELAPTGRYDVDILTDDLRLVVEAAETWSTGDAAKGGVRLVAHDWGGPIAWTLTERCPGLVKHLYAINAPHPAAYVRELRSPRQLFRSWYILAFQIPGIERLAEKNDAALLLKMMTSSSPPGLFSEEDLAMYRASLARPGRARAVLAYYQQAFGGDITTRIKQILRSDRIRVPATILWGDADKAIASSHPEATRRYVEHLEVRRLIGVSHWVPEERPTEVALAIT